MKYLISVICIFQLSFAIAQNPVQHCGTDEQMRIFYQSNPQSLIEAKNFDLFTKQFVNANNNNVLNNTTLHTYTIPVVVHVLASSFYSPSATITLAKMKTAIAKTNEDFQGLNPEFAGIDPQFAGVKRGFDMQFELAQIDPEGNPTTGVIFHPYTEKGFGNGSGYDAKIQSYAWNNYKYMNVYIMYDLYDNGVLNNSGVAWYPDASMSDNNLARVVYNGSYIYGNVANSFAHVLSHEFAHFFNLIHTFQDGCIADPSLGDQVADTPPTVGSQGCTIPTNNCFSNPVNLQNFMDYNTNCYGMFTTGQVLRMSAATVQQPARQPLWQSSNLTATGVDGIIRKTIGNADSCTYTFREVEISNGTIVNPISLSAKNGAHFAQSSGTWIPGTHYSVQNLPAGLTTNIVIINDSSAVFTLIGTATNHAAANSITNLKIFFLNAGVAGGVAAIFNSSLNFKIAFKGDPTIVYGNNNMNTNYVSEVSRCYYGTTFSFGNVNYGLYWLDGLRFDSHQQGVMCQTGTTNIKPLADSAVVGPASSEWANAGASPNLHFISSGTYSSWNGTINAIGVRFTNDNGNTLYGWIRLRVSNDGSRMSLIDYAYNENPDQPIVVGRGAKPILVPEFEGLLEADINNGSLDTQQPYNLVGATFVMNSGTLVRGVHYDRGSIPAWTQEPILTIVNNKKVVLSFPGNAINHAKANNFSVPFDFFDAAFTGGNASNIIGADRDRSVSVTFKDPHHYENVNVQQTINASNNWYWFQMGTNLPVSYYLNSFAFQFTNNSLTLIPYYDQPLVAESVTNNISLIPANTVIGPASNWNYNVASPNQANLSSVTYTAWYGQEGYIGIYTNDYDCRMYYGYLHVRVSADGKSVNFLDYAFNTKPDLPIITPAYATPLVSLCQDAATTIITSDITGSSYQWQLNTGSGFNNIIDNSNYGGTNTIKLQLNNIPSTFYGYQYRCVVNGINSDTFALKFINRWTGASSAAWENPGNWSCGVLPNENSEVIIDSGPVVVNSNVSIRSFLVNPGVNFKVNPAFNLKINH